MFSFRYTISVCKQKQIILMKTIFFNIMTKFNNVTRYLVTKTDY